MCPDDQEPLPDRLEGLSRFLDEEADPFERVCAINYGGVPEDVRTSFVRRLDPDIRLVALRLCNRPTILDEWARCGSEEERMVVAGNSDAETGTLMILAADTSERVRREVVLNLSSCPIVWALLSGDRAIGVRSAFEEIRSRYAEVFEPVDDLPGEDDSLDFLYSMVPAAEAEDLIQQLHEDRTREYGEQVLREIERREQAQFDQPDEPDEPVEDESEASAGPQALALLRHALGAQRL